jgi:hypothetical protein
MQIQERSSTCIPTQKTHITLTTMEGVEVPVRRQATSRSNRSAPVLQSFEQMQPLCFSERFPRFTCFLITCGIFAVALVTEIECLRGAGYFWR